MGEVSFVELFEVTLSSIVGSKVMIKFFLYFTVAQLNLGTRFLSVATSSDTL